MIVWDEAKREQNLRNHGIDLADVGCVFDAPMVTVEDKRKVYGEQRLQSLGWFRDRVSSSASISRTTTLPENTPNGLHWAPDEQRSALEYKFSEQNTMRVRMGHHGGELQGLWRF